MSDADVAKWVIIGAIILFGVLVTIFLFRDKGLSNRRGRSGGSWFGGFFDDD